MCSSSSFWCMAGVLTFFVGNFFERGQADLQPFFTFHPWLYLVLIPALSMRLWAEERKQRHDRAVSDPADPDDRGGARQIPRRLVLCRDRARADLSVLADRHLSRPARQRGDPGELYRQLADGRRAAWRSAPASRRDQEPGHRLCRHRGDRLCSDRRRDAGGGRAVPGLGARMADPCRRPTSLFGHFNAITRGVIDLPDLVYFLSIMVAVR